MSDFQKEFPHKEIVCIIVRGHRAFALDSRREQEDEGSFHNIVLPSTFGVLSCA